jgi:hypothetical protein
LRAGDDLEDAFAWKEERTLSQSLTLQCDKVIFILEPSDQAKAAIGKRVTVIDHPHGRLRWPIRTLNKRALRCLRVLLLREARHPHSAG